MRGKNDWKYSIVCLIVFVVFFGIQLVFSQEDYTREEKQLMQRYKIANSLFEKGKKHFVKEKFKVAEKEFKKCLEKMPEHADAHFFLSQICDKQGEIQKSLEHIEKAKENYQHIIKIKLNTEQQYMIKLQEQKMEMEEYLTNMKERLARTKDKKEQAMLRTEIAKAENEVNIINSRLMKPVPTLHEEENFPADYFYLHGNILFKLKRYQDAFTQYLKAIKINPEHGNAYNNLANLYYMDKQYQKALGCLNQAEAKGVTINPEFKKVILKNLDKNPE